MMLPKALVIALLHSPEGAWRKPFVITQSVLIQCAFQISLGFHLKQLIWLTGLQFYMSAITLLPVILFFKFLFLCLYVTLKFSVKYSIYCLYMYFILFSLWSCLYLFYLCKEILLLVSILAATVMQNYWLNLPKFFELLFLLQKKKKLYLSSFT